MSSFTKLVYNYKNITYKITFLGNRDYEKLSCTKCRFCYKLTYITTCSIWSGGWKILTIEIHALTILCIKLYMINTCTLNTIIGSKLITFCNSTFIMHCHNVSDVIIIIQFKTCDIIYWQGYQNEVIFFYFHVLYCLFVFQIFDNSNL